MQPNYKKIITSTILFTFLSLLIITAITMAIMFFAFTKNLANFFYNIGCENIASSLYYKTYEKTDDIYYCYKALTIKISLNDSDDIVEYYDEFVGHDDYNDFIKSTREKSEKLDVSTMEKSILLSDENYMLNAYVKSLIELDKKSDAINIAVDKFYETEYMTLKDQGMYSLGVFVDKGIYDVFCVEYKNSGILLIDKMQDNFDSCVGLFEIYKDSSENIDKAYLMMLGNRIIDLGQDINTICDNIEKEVNVDNLNKMLEVNRVIKGLL